MTTEEFLNEITQTYDTLTAKIKADLDEQYQKGRIKGTDYANVYTKLMSEALQLAMQEPIQRIQERLTEEQIVTQQKQQQMIERQTQGFDDHLKQKMLDIQLNAWSLMFSSGMLDAKPAIIENDEVTKLYNNLKSQLGIN